ncbi:hypothetical protein GCM10023107_06350 [Actinoplanes octamycinicus]|nr:hypothetical protein Aoc01nite_07940 [Actinoplanes octamycinicus]
MAWRSATASISRPQSTPGRTARTRPVVDVVAAGGAAVCKSITSLPRRGGDPAVRRHSRVRNLARPDQFLSVTYVM